MKYLRYAAIAWLVLALFQVTVFAVTGMWLASKNEAALIVWLVLTIIAIAVAVEPE